MIKVAYNQYGLTLFEVLIATLLFSIVVLGFISFQSVLLSELTHAKHRYLAEKMAFQILEVYPDTISVDLPNNWQYQIKKTQHGSGCLIVKVTIQPSFGNDITQARWFCR